jgi:acyl-coenzyme A synthetase/AMP-(fatty) acid ligase
MLVAEAGIATARAMFAGLGLSKEEAEKRIGVLGSDLRWAGGPAATRSSEAAGLLSLEDLLSRGALDEEETVEDDADAAHCYSSGTTGNPKVRHGVAH